jgi:hypothetical protein
MKVGATCEQRARVSLVVSCGERARSSRATFSSDLDNATWRSKNTKNTIIAMASCDLVGMRAIEMEPKYV